MITRRDFVAAASALALTPNVKAFAASGAEASQGPLLISIFLRGGMDALSLIAPVDDPDYIAARAIELRLLGDGDRPALRLEGGPKGNDFRIHPEAAPLLDLYRSRRLAFVHAAGIANGTRSHFGAQELVERGLTNPEESSRIQGGWMARWLAAAGAAERPAFAATPSVPEALNTHRDTICAPDLRYGLGLPGGKQAHEVLTRVYHEARGPMQQASLRTLDGIQLIDGRLRQADGKVAPYAPAHGATYEESEIGRSLQSVARVIRMDLGIPAFAIDMGGWDTHENQPGRFSALVGQLARGLAAFHLDLQDRLNHIVVVAMTEFGRRLRSNKSNGTDHGHGGVMLVSAPKIAGGVVHGRWPGLKSASLDNGVDLAVTTDIRNVLGELMAGPLATPQARAGVFPQFQLKSVGLLTSA
jgi:uncharacterized protein (DUF1501 family)